MTSAYQIESVCEVFGAACDHFDSLIHELCGERSARMEHGEVENLISLMGTEIMRLLMQAHLDLRAMREPRRDDVVGPDGSPLSHCRKGRTRDLMSVFGGLRVARKGYSVRGARSLCPMDVELNLCKDKYSHGLRHRLAEEVAGNSFDGAVASIEKTTGGRVPKRQAEEVAVAVAQDFEAFYSQREHQTPEPTADPLVMSVDQKGVVMRQEDLRPSTRKAAEKKADQPSCARLAPGEKPNRKRMATVAAVYSIQAQARTPEMVMGLSLKEDRPRARNKRVWASVEREPEQVIGEMFEEALRRDPQMRRPWAVLLDGAEKQLDLVIEFIFRYRPEVILILDFIHVLEYVWKAAYAFHPVGSKEAEQWVSQRALLILQGKAQSVAAQMRQSARVNKLGSKKRKPVIKCADYLEKYDTLLDYDEYLKEGLPIATGVIEGACRHLIKDRMDLTGARWRLKRAEAVLKIRSLRSSGDFHAYWSFHLEQEKRRNYPHLHDSATRASTPTGNNAKEHDHEVDQRKAA
jgi:hypothetical protein